MQVRHATILFADLRGFTGMLAATPPSSAFALLNRWLTAMGEVVAAHGGAIAGFNGDAIMVVSDEARRALACAVDMQIAMQALPELDLAVGLNSGKVIEGVLGAEAFSARTVIGQAVNLAARIEAFCLRGQVLASETTLRECPGFAETGEPLEVLIKGSNGGVMLREVHGIAGSGKRVPRRDRRGSPRVPVHLPFTYQRLANDVLSTVRDRGLILDMSHRGALIEIERELGLFEELRLEVRLPDTGYVARDLYGRVVNPKARHLQGYRYGVEFTSLGEATAREIQALVQRLVPVEVSPGR